MREKVEPNKEHLEALEDLRSNYENSEFRSVEFQEWAGKPQIKIASSKYIYVDKYKDFEITSISLHKMFKEIHMKHEETDCKVVIEID